MTRTLPRLTAACGAALLSVGLVACGSSTATSPGTPATAPVQSAIATAPPADDATDGATADDATTADDTGDGGTATATTPADGAADKRQSADAAFRGRDRAGADGAG